MEGRNEVKTVVEKLSRQTFSSPSAQIDEVIKINFDGLSPIRQNAFLDVAVTFWVASSNFELEKFRDYLMICYEREFSDSDDLLEQLMLDGLLRFDGDKVVIHDSYLELAQQEAASSGRFLLTGTMDMKMVDWAKLERIVLYDDAWKGESMGMDLTNDCPNVQVLMVGGRFFLRELRLESMRSLRVLKITLRGRGKVTGLRTAERLAVLEAEFLDRRKPFHIAEVESLTRLQSLSISADVENCKGPLDLRSCSSLKTLRLVKFGMLDGDCLPALRNLRSLSIRDSERSWRKNLLDLSGLCDLEFLDMEDYDFVKEAVSLPSKLQCLKLKSCRSLKRLVEIRTLDQLKSVQISNCNSLEEIDALPSKLQNLWLESCGNLKRLLGIRTLTQLESIQISYGDSLEEIECFPSNIRELQLTRCPCLKRLLFDCQSSTQLQNLEIVESSLDVSWSLLFPNLQKLCLGDCPNLRKLPVAIQLKILTISVCPSLDEISSFPLKLLTLQIFNCESLLKIGEFTSSLDIDDDPEARQSTPELTSVLEPSCIQSIGEFPSSLQELSIHHHEFLRKFPQLPSDLIHLNIAGCGSIGEMPPNLQNLSLHQCEFVQGILKCPSSLTYMRINVCQSLQGISEFSSNLKCLIIEDCGSLENIPEFPSQVETILFQNCPNLRKFPSTSGLGNLRLLQIKDCAALQEIGDRPAGMSVAISNCGFLEKESIGRKKSRNKKSRRM